MSDNDASGTRSGADEDAAGGSPGPAEDAASTGDDAQGAPAGPRTDDGAAETAPTDERDGRAGDPEETLAGESTLASEPVSPDEIDPEELTIPVRSLNPRVRIVWILNAVVTSAILGGMLAAAAWFFEFTYLVPAGVAGVLLVFGIVHALLRYRVWRYEVREDALYLERGVFTRVRTVVPFVRIQHVDTSRSPVERITGLASSVVYTAGSRGADVTIPGLEPDRAEDLQHRLKRLAIAAEGDTAV